MAGWQGATAVLLTVAVLAWVVLGYVVPWTLELAHGSRRWQARPWWTRGLVAGASVVFWSFAPWLFPVLLAAGWWRHVLHRVPLSYEPGLWSVIFPLGMYAVAGIYLGRADQLPLVAAIGPAELWLAVAACRVSLPAGRDRGPSAGRRGGQGRRRP
ncbi:hypothetical protein [Arthrobacter sp. NicSoilC5]|uniref:SLAC1 family transporter n=1 Tax=Arthrobacter sp. NicSoilC5 TaxID=2831000 RepID=UPI001CC55246|nr:hypothetical protein [Arthrobacter sp. NicSoilC5]BCW81885.1 hypothetical protein NicSoilC5_39040 [Arthrobacter sp. NicSoilC5]